MPIWHGRFDHPVAVDAKVALADEALLGWTEEQGAGLVERVAAEVAVQFQRRRAHHPGQMIWWTATGIHEAATI